nr:methyltransferase type 11 [Georgenia sp. SUBG003]
MGYALAYRLGLTPWEHHGRVTRSEFAALLDREASIHGRSPGRALDPGCGRGQYAPALAARGWEVVGVDCVPRAVEAASRKGVPGACFVVGDVTSLEAAGLGSFNFFLDVGCFQGLSPEQRLGEGRGVSELANPGATLLMLALGATRMCSVVGGVTQEEVEAAFPGWEVVSVDAADTSGLGWPLTTTAPRWYRLRRP